MEELSGRANPNRARDERRRKARFNRQRTPYRIAAQRREREKRHARGDYRIENRAAYKSYLNAEGSKIVADERARITRLKAAEVGSPK